MPYSPSERPRCARGLFETEIATEVDAAFALEMDAAFALRSRSARAQLLSSDATAAEAIDDKLPTHELVPFSPRETPRHPATPTSEIAISEIVIETESTRARSTNAVFESAARTVDASAGLASDR